jgi:hypothetical protein
MVIDTVVLPAISAPALNLRARSEHAKMVLLTEPSFLFLLWTKNKTRYKVTGSDKCKYQVWMKVFGRDKRSRFLLWR